MLEIGYRKGLVFVVLVPESFLVLNEGGPVVAASNEYHLAGHWRGGGPPGVFDVCVDIKHAKENIY